MLTHMGVAGGGGRVDLKVCVVKVKMKILLIPQP